MSLVMDKLKEKGVIREIDEEEKNKSANVLPIARNRTEAEQNAKIINTPFISDRSKASRATEQDAIDFATNLLPTAIKLAMPIASDTSKIIGNLGLGAYTGVLNLGQQFTRRMNETMKNEQEAFNKVNDMFGRPELNKENYSPYQKTIDFYDNSLNEANSKIQKNIDETTNPVSRKLAELSTSMGNMLPGMLPGGSVYFAGSAANQYYKEGLERGMNDKQADVYGGIMGLVEGGTETLGAWLTKGIGSKIAKGQVANALKFYGLDVTENFLEEAVIEPISEASSLIVGRKDTADFSNMGKRMLESGIDGALISIIMGGASAGIGKAINVYDKYQKGEPISSTEMREAIKETQDSGVVNVEETMKDGVLNTLVDMQNQEQIKRQAPVVNEQYRVKKDNIIDRVKDPNVEESTTNIQSTNELPTAKTAPSELIRGINQKTKNNIELDADNLGKAKAKIEGNKITLDYEKGSLADVIHETSHYSESNSKGYETLKDYVLNELDKSGELQDIKDDITSRYAEVYKQEGREFTNADLESEVVAKYTERFIDDEIFVEKMARTDRNTVQKIYDWIKDKVNYYKTVVKMEPEQKLEYDRLRKAEKLWEKALRGVEEENNNNLKYSAIENSNKSYLKQKQLDIIKENNPMTDDYHTGIRNLEDIKTFEEVMKDDESFVYGDFSKEDAKKALKKGKVTVYSSKPIGQGIFVSTSQNMARDYAGNGKIYSQEVDLKDVAWINGDEGQYAKVELKNKNAKIDEINKKQKISNIQVTEELLNKYNSHTDIMNNFKSQNKHVIEIEENIDISDILNKTKFSEKKNLAVNEAKKRMNNNYKTNSFYNNKKKITVSNGDINHAIQYILNNDNQLRLLGEHLSIFNKLGDIIENAEIVSQSEVNELPSNETSWHYFYDNLLINNEKYKLVFDVVSRNDGENHYRVQSLEKNEGSSVKTDNNISTSTWEEPSLNNSITSSKKDVNTTNNKYMQKSQNVAPTAKDKSAPKYSLQENSNKSSLNLPNNNEIKIQGLEDYSVDELKSNLQNDIRQILDNNGFDDIEIVDLELHGSRLRGTAKNNSDLDIVVQYKGDARGDTLFDTLNENPIEINGIKVDINPIQENLKDYMKRSNEYDKEILSKNNDTKYSLDDTSEVDKLRKYITKEYNIKNKDNLAELKSIFDDFIENENADKLFSKLMDFSQKIVTEPMEDASDILKDLRARKYEIDDTIKKDIADYNEFRKSIFGDIKLVNKGKGTPIDVHYQELANIRPDLFPLEITNATDQLLHIVDVINELKRPYLLKDIIGQTNIENDIMEKVNNYINANPKLMEAIVGGKNGEEGNVDEGYSPRISKKDVEGGEGNAERLARAEKEALDKGETVRKFYKNVYSAQVISDEIKNSLKPKSYRKLTNDESMVTAIAKLNNDMEEEAKWRRRDIKKTNSVDVAEGLALLAKYQSEGKYEQTMEVIDRLAEIGTKGGQQVQMFALLQRLTPEGMLMYAQKSLNRALEEEAKYHNQKWIDEHTQEYKLTEEDTKFISERMDKVAGIEDGRDKQILLGEIQKRISDKLPPDRGASIKAYMRLSMLFNTKTQIRNILGNMVIAPVNAVGDTFATMADKAIAKKTGMRTKGLTDIKSVVQGAITGAYKSIDDFKRGIDTRNLAGDRFEIGGGSKNSYSNKTAIGRAMNSLDRTLSFMLDLGDRPFYESAFLNSINNQMKLNDVTIPSANMIEIATSEALQRTWQDSNNYTKAVLKIRDILNGKIGDSKGMRYGLGDLLIPFAKTPANLTKAIVDYSPVGLTKTLVSDARKLSNAISKGQDVSMYQHKFVDNLGKGLAGSFLYIIASALVNAGIITGANDDDKDVANFMKNTLGIQPYSVRIGDKSFTYDWAQPVAVPFAIMADVAKSKDDKDILSRAVSGLIAGSDQLLQQSFMASINDVINGNNSILENLADEALDLPARAVPTFLKQIADMVDGTQRTSFDKTSVLETAKNKVLAKLPGASQTLAPAVDTFGREIQKYGGDNNLFNVMFNPANTNKGKMTESAKEVYDLYKATGDKTIFPIQVAYSIDLGDEKLTLNPYKRAMYQMSTGQYSDSTIKSLIKSSDYKKLSNEDKINILRNVTTDSNLHAKKEVFNYDTDKETQKEKSDETGITLPNMYIYKNIINQIEAERDSKGEAIAGTRQSAMANYILAMNTSNEQKNKLLGEMTTSDVKITVSDLNKVGKDNYTQFYSISNAQSKEKYKALASTGMKSSELNKYWNNINKIEGEKDANGKTISGSKKKAVQDYINGLKLSVGEKLLLYASTGNYTLSYNEKEALFNYINSIKSMTINEKQSLVKSLKCFE